MTASAASPGSTTPLVDFLAAMIALLAEIVSTEGVDSVEAASVVASVAAGSAAVGVESSGHDQLPQAMKVMPLGFEHRYAA
jgi:hypothetical protein